MDIRPLVRELPWGTNDQDTARVRRECAEILAELPADVTEPEAREALEPTVREPRHRGMATLAMAGHGRDARATRQIVEERQARKEREARKRELIEQGVAEVFRGTLSESES